MEIKTVKIQKPDGLNLILGQSHFIKTVEDIHEALVNTVPGIKFGLAFCESSGPCLVRYGGTDSELTELAKDNAFEVIIAESEQGRGILGVIDGLKSKGIETEKDIQERKEFLRKIGYKL